MEKNYMIIFMWVYFKIGHAAFLKLSQSTPLFNCFTTLCFENYFVFTSFKFT